MSISTLKYLGESVGPLFDAAAWHKFAEVVSGLMRETLPTELLEPLVDNNIKFSVPLCIDKCVIQVNLILACREVFQACADVPLDPMQQLLNSLQVAYEFARNFNRDHERRNQLWAGGFLSNTKTLPGLFRLENEALKCLLTLLFYFHKSEKSVQAPLYALCKQVLAEQLQRDEVSPERQQELDNLMPVVSELVLPEVEQDLETALQYMGSELVGLVVSEDLGVRQQLKTILLATLSLVK